MFFQAVRNGCVIRITRTGARVDHDIHGGQLMLMKTKRFANQSFDSIAADRIPNDTSSD